MSLTRQLLEKLVWNHTHQDYRATRADGTRAVLHYNSQRGGTESWPLSSFTDQQLLDQLPKRVRDEVACLVIIQNLNPKAGT